MNPFATGSLVRWRKGTLAGDVYGIVVDFERQKPGWSYAVIDGAWLHLPNQQNLVWTALSSIEAIVQTGSFV